MNSMRGIVSQPPHAHSWALVTLLLDADADPNDAQGLYNTMFRPENRRLKLLLERGLTAAALGNVAAIRCLLSLGADPNATADDGTTALHQAAWNDRRAAAECLVAHGARPLRDANHESTPAGWANHAGHAALRDYLLDHCPDGLDLVSFGTVDALRRYLAEHPDFATGTLPGGGSPLHHLCDDTDQAPRSTAGEQPANRGQWRVRLPHNRTAGVDILPRETGCLNTSTIHGSPPRWRPVSPCSKPDTEAAISRSRTSTDS